MSEQDVLGLLRRIQDQLSTLERKVDALMNKPQSQERPSSRPPFRSFGPPRYGQGQTEYSSSRERGSDERRSFDKRGGQGKSFDKRPSDSRPFEKRPGEGRPFEKRPGEGRPFEKRNGKKPFIHKGKGR